MNSFTSILLKKLFSGGYLLCCLLFCHSILSPIISHHYALRYFISGEVDYQTRTRVPPGGYIMYQSHILLLNCHRALFLHLLNRYGGFFPHRFIHCSSEENVPWWLLKNVLSEDNHRITCTGYLYLNRCNRAAWYFVYLFRLGSRIYLDGGITCLGIRC